MTKKIEKIKCESPGRIDSILSAKLPYSRTQIQRWIKRGQLTVGAEIIIDKSYRCEEGETAQLSLDEKDISDEIKNEDKPLDVLYEDDNLIAVNKPSKMIIHPAAGVKENTLVNRLLYHYPELEQVGGRARAGLVHRLDKGTSGVVLIARNRKSMTELQNQFKERQVQKKYRAVLTGELDDTRLRIEVPLARHPAKPMLRVASASGKQSETKIEVVARANGLSSVWCWPKTGRTHQIRVHCKYIGHPVLGDKKYGGKKAERLMLHAEEICFRTPEKRKELKITAPPPREVLEQWNKQIKG